jgi:hypothetical protein
MASEPVHHSRLWVYATIAGTIAVLRGCTIHDLHWFNLLRTSVRYINIYVVAEEAECDISTASPALYWVALFGTYDSGEPNKQWYCILGRRFHLPTCMDHVCFPRSFFITIFIPLYYFNKTYCLCFETVTPLIHYFIFMACCNQIFDCVMLWGELRSV